MQIEVLKSKIHRVTVTGAELHYVGSITIDAALMEAAQLVAGEKVQVVNINNGERLETYVIQGEKNSGEITLNGPAARKVRREFFLPLSGATKFCGIDCLSLEALAPNSR